jgi:hypothetical protein
MTILEHDPMTSDCTSLNQELGILLHALTEGQEVELAHSNTDFLNKLLDFSLRIGTWTQNEDDWGLLG